MEIDNTLNEEWIKHDKYINKNDGTEKSMIQYMRKGTQWKDRIAQPQ